MIQTIEQIIAAANLVLSKEWDIMINMFAKKR
jgi:hypothetical protein